MCVIRSLDPRRWTIQAVPAEKRDPALGDRDLRAGWPKSTGDYGKPQPASTGPAGSNVCCSLAVPCCSQQFSKSDGVVSRWVKPSPLGTCIRPQSSSKTILKNKLLEISACLILDQESRTRFCVCPEAGEGHRAPERSGVRGHGTRGVQQQPYRGGENALPSNECSPHARSCPHITNVISLLLKVLLVIRDRRLPSPDWLISKGIHEAGE